MLTVWGRSNSVNVMKVLWVCGELGVTYQHIEAGREHGKVDTPGYLDMNPNGRVPTVNDDGFVLWESNVIVRYLSYKYGLGSMYPTDMRQRAVAEQWMEWQQTTVAPALAWPFHALVREHPDYRDEKRLAEAPAALNRAWGILEDRLAGRDYVMGSALTMADIPLGAAAWRWLNLPIERVELANVAAWHERLLTHEPFREHVARPLS